jgi:hypothetical protein
MTAALLCVYVGVGGLSKLFIQTALPCRLLYNRWRGGDASMRGFKRNQRRSMHVSEISLSEGFGSIGITNEQVGTGRRATEQVVVAVGILCSSPRLYALTTPSQAPHNV